jgi:DNA ligase-1
MSSPAKRRKKNDGSSQPGRGLDYFFAKQREKIAKAPPAPTTEQIGEVSHESSQKQEHGSGNISLSDEELARRLQEQFDREDAETRDAETSEPRPQEPPQDLETAAELATISNGTDSKDNVVNQSSPPRPLPDRTPKTLKLESTATDEDTVTSELPFDESPLKFEPPKYIPTLKQHWAADSGHASYALLTRCFVLVNATTSRIKIIDTLVNLLRTIIESDPESLLPAVWLATNSIAPPYVDMELGLGGSAISKALKKVYGLDSAGLKLLYSKHGDPGDVAFEAKKKQSFTLRKPKPLTIQNVYSSLVRIATSKGQGSQEAKQRLVERLLQDSRGAEESRYIVRTLVQHLRIGAVRTTMLIALGRAVLLSKPEGSEYPTRPVEELAKLKKEDLAEVYTKAEEIVKACFARHPSYADLVPALLEVGICEELLLRCGLTLHIPLRPMLGSITRDLGDMLTKLQGREFACEYKYDGQRAQVHCDAKGKVSIFSRHLEVMTDKYPDLVSLVPTIRGEGVSSFILEGEVVAVDKETGDLKPFQVLSNRARKDVAIHEVSVNVCLFAFDLMYLNGEELMNRPFRERRSLLRSLFVEIPRHFTWVKNLDATSNDSETVLQFFNGATDIKCEGIMVKVLDNTATIEIEEATALEVEPEVNETPRSKAKSKSKSKSDPSGEPTEKKGRRKALLSTYEPDKRLESWLKVKKDYHASADTIDLVPIAGWHGQGRKSKWWSPILLAARNPTTGQFVPVTKCISGFTDEFYKANRLKYDPDSGTNAISRPAYIEYGGSPDVWFEPQEVWEIAFADITQSPTYIAAIGLVSEERGLSLRFPRFLRVRDDKGIDDASTEEFLADLWFKQASRPGQDGKPEGEDDDFD